MSSSCAFFDVKIAAIDSNACWNCSRCLDCEEYLHEEAKELAVERSIEEMYEREYSS